MSSINQLINSYLFAAEAQEALVMGNIAECITCRYKIVEQKGYHEIVQFLIETTLPKASVFVMEKS